MQNVAHVVHEIRKHLSQLDELLAALAAEQVPFAPGPDSRPKDSVVIDPLDCADAPTITYTYLVNVDGRLQRLAASASGP